MCALLEIEHYGPAGEFEQKVTDLTLLSFHADSTPSYAAPFAAQMSLKSSVQ